MKKNKGYTPLQTDSEQKGIHIKVLIGAIIVTVIVFVIAVTSLQEVMNLR